MRTNSTSSFGSSDNLEEVISSVSTVTSGEIDPEHSKRLKSYGKFFATRLIQILVQSRTNERTAIPCVATQPQNDWFNIHVDELGEVAAQIKRSITKFPPSIPQLCVDFFLYTVDQETLPLESWCFSVDESDRGCPTDHKSDIYHQLGTLLKSSMVAARMTPMHRYYVKKQSADTYVILYRIIGGPSTIDLGSEAKRVSVGYLPTALGAYKLDLAYRTRMEIDRTITPVLDTTITTESFQRISTTSPGTTPDSGNMVGSPMSFGMCSHFSASPPSLSTFSSPVDDPELMKSPANFRPARSRTTSVASDGEPAVVGSPSTKETVSSSQNSLKKIPKNMPFANLLAVSFTGTLFPVPEEDKKYANGDDVKGGSDSSGSTIVASDSGSADSEEEEKSKDRSAGGAGVGGGDSDDDFDLDPQTRERKVTMVPLHRAAELSQSQGTVVGGGEVDMHSTLRSMISPVSCSSPLELHDIGNAASPAEMKTLVGEPGREPEGQEDDRSKSGSSGADDTTSEDSGLLLNRTLSSEGGSCGGGMKPESDDDSFVKIPVFIGNSPETTVQDSNLGDLISSCRSAPMLESFTSEDFVKIEQELDRFSMNQGLFDRFVAEIRENVDDCDE